MESNMKWHCVLQYRDGRGNTFSAVSDLFTFHMNLNNVTPTHTWNIVTRTRQITAKPYCTGKHMGSVEHKPLVWGERTAFKHCHLGYWHLVHSPGSRRYCWDEWKSQQTQKAEDSPHRMWISLWRVNNCGVFPYTWFNFQLEGHIR